MKLLPPKRAVRLPGQSALDGGVIEQPEKGETSPGRSSVVSMKPPPAMTSGVVRSPYDLLSPEQRWRYATASHSEGPLND
jgi:hypothetical protein